MEKPETKYIGQYRTESRYGGPEEGGWYVRINVYMGNSVGPFLTEKAIEVQSALKEAQWRTSASPYLKHLDRRTFILEDKPGQHDKGWEDVPSEAFVYQ
tara:strand:- start:3146 stop:3442 length:297 start_codon:yes stop_codon:yes gene_type:complete